jgi:hypothetical protein
MLTAKRATLLQLIEQHVGQINRINGAVAQLDELIGELEREAEKEREEAAGWPVTDLGGIDRSPSLYWVNGTGSFTLPEEAPTPDASPSMTPPSPPEMFERALCEGCAYSTDECQCVTQERVS